VQLLDDIMQALDIFEGNVFSGSHLDRAGNMRRNPEWLARQINAPTARFLPIWQLKVPVAVNPAPRLFWLSPAQANGHIVDANPILLGVDETGAPYFALDADIGNAPTFDGVEYQEVRSVAPTVTRSDAALLAQARSLVDWHQRHGFCAVCGSATQMRDAGYVRRCSNTACGAQHFPRTDPVVIMLIQRGDYCLVGRQKWFPTGFYSTLAGFMEPGESIEEAVRREVQEESGIVVGEVRYHSSQPWPYPSSLMIGCFGEALGDEIVVDKLELEDARWVDRDTVRRAIDHVTAKAFDPFAQQNATPSADQPELLVPAPMAIAHQLMRSWVYPSAT
jgi:NAD+ diphosphatase